MKNKIFHTQDLCLRTNLRCAEKQRKNGEYNEKIVLTGGGTAGHVTPNIALLPSLKEAGYEVFYIGSYNGIEKLL